MNEKEFENINVIGLIGAPGSGKDTIADFLVKKGYVKFAVADEIKKGYYAESGYTEEQFKAARGTELEQKIRDGLWEFSAKKCEEMKNPTYFMFKVLKAIKNSGTRHAVISDVRTQMECIYFTQFANAKMILILRNYKEELGSNKIPGTKIYLKDVIHHPKFWNISNTLKETCEELEKFYEETILGGEMDSDSSNTDKPPSEP
jgi:hypothetical protein